jgi:hypothetical protein
VKFTAVAVDVARPGGAAGEGERVDAVEHEAGLGLGTTSVAGLAVGERGCRPERDGGDDGRSRAHHG